MNSRFDYSSAGGEYIPTKSQYDAAMEYNGKEPDILEACNMVIFGWSCKEKVSHDYIHIINEKLIRKIQ